jgi:hypothetical protein
MIGNIGSPNIPIVLGITGHRDIRAADLDILGSRITEIFNDLRHRYPRSPLRLLTSLAPGADQLGADVADRLGIEIVAPLPFPPEVYGKSTTFEGYDSQREKFVEWMGKDSLTRFVAPLPQGPNSSDLAQWTKLAADREERHRCYANVGAYIVRHCHALIALWDVESQGKEGGSGEMVRYKLTGEIPATCAPREPLVRGEERGPVFVIHTPRANNPTDAARQPANASGFINVLVPNAASPLAPRELRSVRRKLIFGQRLREWSDLKKAHALPAEKIWSTVLAWPRTDERTRKQVSKKEKLLRRFEWRQFVETCATIDRFNFDVSQNRTLLETAIRQSTGSDPWDQFLKKPTIRGSIAASGMRALLALREAAAFLARRFELPSIATLRLLFIMLFITGFFFDIYAHTNVSHRGAETRPASETTPGVTSPSPIDSPTTTASPATKASPSPGPTGPTGELHNPWFLLGFVTFLVFDFALVEVMSILHLNERRLDYRALAETLRVRLFWALAGIEKSVADTYLGQLRSDLAWARRALRSSAPPSFVWKEYFDQQSELDQLEDLKTVRTEWVEEQLTYYEDTFEKRHHKARRLRIAGFLAAAIGWLVAVCLLIGGWTSHQAQLAKAPVATEPKPSRIIEDQTTPGEHAFANASETPQPFDQIIAWLSSQFDANIPGQSPFLLFSGLVLLGALLIAYSERRCHEELSKQYERMVAVFKQGLAELDEALSRKDIKRAQSILHALGREAITEHSQWLILRRNRPLEMLVH